MAKDPYKLNPLNPDVPKYCTQCGGLMILGIQKPFVNSYDSQTGNPTGVVEYTAKCEQLTTLRGRLGFFRYHDDFLIVDNPNFDTITNAPHRTILTRR